jgi:hypothetical protein
MSNYRPKFSRLSVRNHWCSFHLQSIDSQSHFKLGHLSQPGPLVMSAYGVTRPLGKDYRVADRCDR